MRSHWCWLICWSLPPQGHFLEVALDVAASLGFLWLSSGRFLGRCPHRGLFLPMMLLFLPHPITHNTHIMPRLFRFVAAFACHHYGKSCHRCLVYCHPVSRPPTRVVTRHPSGHASSSCLGGDGKTGLCLPHGALGCQLDVELLGRGWASTSWQTLLSPWLIGRSLVIFSVVTMVLPLYCSASGCPSDLSGLLCGAGFGGLW